MLKLLLGLIWAVSLGRFNGLGEQIEGASLGGPELMDLRCCLPSPTLVPPVGFIWKVLSDYWALVPQDHDASHVDEKVGGSSKDLEDTELLTVENAFLEHLLDSDESISEF